MIKTGFEQVVVIGFFGCFRCIETPKSNVFRGSQSSRKVNQNRKKKTANIALSCNFNYFKSPKIVGMATLSKFLTDDKIGKPAISANGDAATAIVRAAP